MSLVGPEEQPGEMRGDPSVRVTERRAVAQANQRQELVQLAVAVDRQDLFGDR